MTKDENTPVGDVALPVGDVVIESNGKKIEPKTSSAEPKKPSLFKVRMQVRVRCCSHKFVHTNFLCRAHGAWCRPFRAPAHAVI